MEKTIKHICSVLPSASIEGDANVVITNIAVDSREVKKGSLFICIEGIHSDGHDYIEKAYEAGALAVVVSKEIPLPAHITAIRVCDTREAMLLIAPFFYDYPASKMRMIGVTGTNGKTTTSHIIAHILEEQGYTVGVIGTVHVLINKVSYGVHNTTPDAGDLQPILYKMVQAGVTHCVMEVSSHALDQRRVAGIEFDTAVFTNLTQDHLDYHKTFENYLGAKVKLFEKVSEKGSKSPKGAVINIDDPYGDRILEKSTCPTLTYSTLGKGTINGDEVLMTSKKTSFTLSYDGHSYEVHTALTGLFNVYNTLGAIGASLIEGIPIEKITEALRSFTSVPGRFELIDEGQSFAVVVDYAHTPDGLENILTTAKSIAESKIIVVFGCGGDRDATKRPLMGNIAAKYGDYIIVTSDNPRTEDPLTIISDVEKGVKEGMRASSSYKVIPDRQEAIFEAINMAADGDIVVIAGKGHENYQILHDRTIHFDDREVARKALAERF